MLLAKHLLMLEEVKQQNQPFEGIKLVFELLAVAQAIDADCAKRLSRYKLSEARFVILVLLAKHASLGLTPSALADLAGVTRGTMTSLLDGLEKPLLISRVPDPLDRRAICICITDQGLTLVNELRQVHARWIDNLCRNLNAAERETATTLLHKIWLTTDASADNGIEAR